MPHFTLGGRMSGPMADACALIYVARLPFNAGAAKGPPRGAVESCLMSLCALALFVSAAFGDDGDMRMANAGTICTRRLRKHFLLLLAH